jgi:hypothetical protein
MCPSNPLTTPWSARRGKEGKRGGGCSSLMISNPYLLQIAWMVKSTLLGIMLPKPSDSDWRFIADMQVPSMEPGSSTIHSFIAGHLHPGPRPSRDRGDICRAAYWVDITTRDCCIHRWYLSCRNFVFSATAVIAFTLCDLLLVDTFIITLI